MYHQLINHIIGLSHLEIGTVEAPNGQVHHKIAPSVIIAQTIEGWYEVTLRGQTSRIAPGEAFCAPTDAPLRIVHRARGSSPMRSRWMHIQFRLWDTVDLTAWLDMPLRLSRQRAAPFGKIIQQLLDLHPPADGHWSIDRLANVHRLAFQTLDHLCLLCPMRPQAAQTLSAITRLEPMFAVIRSGMNRPLTIDRLAEAVGVSASLLHVLCRQLLGCTPMQYVRQNRLNEARRRLIASSDPVALIARDVGFPNPFHFSRTFSRAFGQSPTQYRVDHQLWRTTAL